jgi:hypothetical protein
MNRASASPPASTRSRAGGARALCLTALGALGPLGPLGMSACTLSENGVTPPADTFFYPTSAVMNPADTTGQWLYVANSNADLRFNDGTLVMVNVGDELPNLSGSNKPPLLGAYSDRTARAAEWSACSQENYVHPLPRSDAPICCWDLLDKNILNCDERRYVQADATVLIGSFAAQMVWQPYCDDPCLTYNGATTACDAKADAGRLLIGVRGDTSLTYVDVAPMDQLADTASHPAFHCTADTVAPPLAECDQKVVDTKTQRGIQSGDTQTAALSLPDEPYALTLDDPRGYLYVGHLVGNTSTPDSGGVSLFDISGTGVVSPTGFPVPPRFIAPFGSPFPASNSGLFGVTAISMHEPLGASAASDRVAFASSRYVPLVTSMVALGPSICADDINDDVLLPAGDTLSSGLSGSEMRGVEFIDPLPGSQPNYAQRAYTLQRVPPDLVGFDIAKNEAGGTTVIPTDLSETCSSPTFLYQNDAGEGARLFVNCFDTGEVYIFDPAIPTLITTLAVGRGPAGMVFDRTRAVAYVLDFTQNDISVVDLAPGSATQYHVIQRLGFPTVVPR